MKGGKRVQTARPNRVNDGIRTLEARLTGLGDEALGTMNLREAIEKTEEAGVDLIEISPNAEPPVCRTMSYGKFLYGKSKSSKEQKKRQKVVRAKEIRLRPGTNDGDYQIKLRSLVRFLEDGGKTKITLRSRGREVAHQQISMEVLNRVRDDLSELAVVESFPTKAEDHQMITVFAPKKKQ